MCLQPAGSPDGCAEDACQNSVLVFLANCFQVGKIASKYGAVMHVHEFAFAFAEFLFAKKVQ